MLSFDYLPFFVTINSSHAWYLANRAVTIEQNVRFQGRICAKKFYMVNLFKTILMFKTILISILSQFLTTWLRWFNNQLNF